MSEYIISDDMDILREWIPKLPEIVRCKDFKHFKGKTDRFPALCRLWLPRNLSKQYGIEPDGFCAWGERLLTCHCGDELDTEGVCPSCGRYVRRES